MASTPAASRAKLARRFVVLQKTLGLRFRAAIPADVREEMSQVTHHQLEAMSVIGRGPVTMSELAAAMGTTSMSAMTQLADRMVKMGLVDRHADESDRRVVRLALTEKSRNAVTQYLDAHQKAVLTAFDHLDDDELTSLMAILEKLVDDDSEYCSGPVKTEP